VNGGEGSDMLRFRAGSASKSQRIRPSAPGDFFAQDNYLTLLMIATNIFGTNRFPFAGRWRPAAYGNIAVVELPRF